MDFTNVPPLDLTVSLQILLGLCILHLVLKYGIFKNIAFTHSKAGVMAFETIAGVCVTYLTIQGFVGWFVDPTPIDKLYTPLPRAFEMSELMVAYQLYDLITMFIYKDLFTIAMLVHHILAGILALNGLYNFMHGTLEQDGCLPYRLELMFLPSNTSLSTYQPLWLTFDTLGYCYFFFGLIEVTNIPLTIIDIFKHYPDLIKQYPNTYTAIRNFFAISFILFRLIMWPIVSFEFWTATLTALSSGQIAKATRFGQPWLETTAAVTFLVANAGLTFLQCLWGKTIINGIYKQFFGRKTDKQTKTK
eukprot:m.72824 g.72824  ORF g.72824 m.72824 type:complete len:304 (+) comp14285_c0_seq1:872-1783(+)